MSSLNTVTYVPYASYSTSIKHSKPSQIKGLL